MFRAKHLFTALAATALVAVSSNAMAFGHGGSMRLLASYQPRIDAVADPALKAELSQRLAVLESYFAVCSQRQTHSQALLDAIHEEMRQLQADLTIPANQAEQELAEATHADVIEMAANQ